MAHGPEVHRNLRIGDTGRDVRELQRAINKRLRARDIPRKVAVDGVYGPRTHAAAKSVLWFLGIKRGKVGITDTQIGRLAQKTVRLDAQRNRWERARGERRVRRWHRKRRKPKIVTARQAGLSFQYVWGGKGGVLRGAGHYDAGDKCETAAELVATAKSHHAYHLSLGWGGLSYEALVGPRVIVFANPVDRKSAAVAGQNTGTVNFCVPGSTGDTLTSDEEWTVRWLLDNWHTRRVPKRHRLPRKARSIPWLGHRQFPGQSTSCPGEYLGFYERIWG